MTYLVRRGAGEGNGLPRAEGMIGERPVICYYVTVRIHDILNLNMVLFRRRKPQEDASSSDPNTSDAGASGNDVQPKVSVLVFRVPVRAPTFLCSRPGHFFQEDSCSPSDYSVFCSFQ